MTRLKIGIVTALMMAPFVFLICVGTFHLYQTGWSFISWWPMAACFALAYLLAWWWARGQSQQLHAAVAEDDLPTYWTERDRAAWLQVVKYVAQAPPLAPEQTADLRRYAEDGQKLALTVARIYKPDAVDPFGHLTVPEILTCSELVANDLHALTVQYIPGSHLIRVNDLKFARKAVDWYETGRNVYWLGSAFLNPIKTAAQFAATKVGLQTPFQHVRNSMLHWFYATYLRELGRHLIELNSGRLKVGAKRYRELIAAHLDPARSAPVDVTSASGPPPTTSTEPVTLALVGQVKAGKSSLVNALLGDQRAAVSVTPETMGATRYRLHSEGIPPLTIVDSAGYGEAGATDRDLAAAITLAKETDLLILVCHARNAARRADVEFLDRLKSNFEKLPGLKLPTVIVALTHIDLLTPASEWAPPYDWEAGTRPKEVSIRNAVAAVKDLYGSRIDGVVPVCAAEGKVLNVRDELIVRVASRLIEARGISLLRALHAEANMGKVSKIGSQIYAAGKEVLGNLLKSVPN
jgi:predicted GTPase